MPEARIVGTGPNDCVHGPSGPPEMKNGPPGFRWAARERGIGSTATRAPRGRAHPDNNRRTGVPASTSRTPYRRDDRMSIIVLAPSVVAILALPLVAALDLDLAGENRATRLRRSLDLHNHADCQGCERDVLVAVLDASARVHVDAAAVDHEARAAQRINVASELHIALIVVVALVAEVCLVAGELDTDLEGLAGRQPRDLQGGVDPVALEAQGHAAVAGRNARQGEMAVRIRRGGDRGADDGDPDAALVREGLYGMGRRRSGCAAHLTHDRRCATRVGSGGPGWRGALRTAAAGRHDCGRDPARSKPARNEGHARLLIGKRHGRIPAHPVKLIARKVPRGERAHPGGAVMRRTRGRSGGRNPLTLVQSPVAIRFDDGNERTNAGSEHPRSRYAATRHTAATQTAPPTTDEKSGRRRRVFPSARSRPPYLFPRSPSAQITKLITLLPRPKSSSYSSVRPPFVERSKRPHWPGPSKSISLAAGGIVSVVMRIVVELSRWL